jgi:hypothetical protein
MAKMDLVGRCGIYCGACPIYRGTRGDEEAKKFTKDVWKTPSNRMTCDGCHKLGPEAHGVDCPRRKCMDAKNLEYCIECPEYPTGKCENFENMDRYFRNRGESLRANLERITSGEVGVWLAEEAKRNSCTACGVPVFWEEKSCPRCGKPLK